MGYAKRNKGHAQERMMKKREKKEKKRTMKRGEMAHKQEFTYHPPKISTHTHILIKDYDLLLQWTRSST
jgi:hypothetical protein